jgi:hypothetical protein
MGGARGAAPLTSAVALGVPHSSQLRKSALHMQALKKLVVALWSSGLVWLVDAGGGSSTLNLQGTGNTTGLVGS